MNIISRFFLLFLSCIVLSSCSTARIQSYRQGDHPRRAGKERTVIAGARCDLPKVPRSIREQAGTRTRTPRRQTGWLAVHPARKGTSKKAREKDQGVQSQGSEYRIAGVDIVPPNVMPIYPETLWRPFMTTEEQGRYRPSPEVTVTVLTTIHDHSSDPQIMEYEEEIAAGPGPAKGRSLLAGEDQATRGRRTGRREEAVLGLLALITGILAFLGLRVTPTLSRNISHWATRHPWKTRALITGIHLTAGTIGLVLGDSLAREGIHFSGLTRTLWAGVFLTSALLYPMRKTSLRWLQHSYLRQKAHDLALFVSGFMLMLQLGNHTAGNPVIMTWMDGTSRQGSPEALLVTNSVTAGQAVFREDQPAQQEPDKPARKELSVGVKVLLTFLLVVAGLAAAYGIGAAACNLSCSGMEGLAWLVGVGGGLLALGLFIWAMRSLWWPKYKRELRPYKV